MRGSQATVRSENLAVVFTDIVGFTATTANQSREANASLLARHDRVLIPIARKFGGRRVKSIGDALLLVFRSSTDALLCAMAMQDALYEANRKHPTEPEIHIRVAVNVGEVRVTKGDVFGEAVNTAARLEGITPADSIYLTKAVYMTMNRAEVPVEEVGAHQFKGVDEAVDVYQVPRFTPVRLVPEKRPPAAPGKAPTAGFSYPFGGVHLLDYQGQTLPGANKHWRSPLVLGAVLGGLGIVALAGYLLWPSAPRSDVGDPVVLPSPPVVPPSAAPVPPPPPLPQSPRPGTRHTSPDEVRIQAVLEQVGPWLLENGQFVSPVRLKDAPLPLGSPQPDPLDGELPLQWQDLPVAEQHFFAALKNGWDGLEPAAQHRLINTARIWRGAAPEQRGAVVAEVRQWMMVEGVERTLARRRLDYLLSLPTVRRDEIIAVKQLALPLIDARSAFGAQAPNQRQPSYGVEVMSRPLHPQPQTHPQPIFRPAPQPEHQPAPQSPPQAPPWQPPYPGQSGPPPDRHDQRRPPPRNWNGDRPPPPPWERNGRPPPPR